MRLKKLTACCLAMVMIASAMSGTGGISASEAVSPEIAPGGTSSVPLRWTTTSRVDTSLSYSGLKAKCKVEIEAFSGTTKIVADVRLYTKTPNGTYTPHTFWLNQSVSGDYLYVSKETTITSGVTYLLEVSARVTRNGYTETVLGSMENTAP